LIRNGEAGDSKVLIIESIKSLLFWGAQRNKLGRLILLRLKCNRRAGLVQRAKTRYSWLWLGSHLVDSVFKSFDLVLELIDLG